MNSTPINKIFSTPEKLSKVLSPNPKTPSKTNKDIPSSPSKEKVNASSHSKEKASINYLSFSKYINPQRLKPYEDMLKKNIRSFNIIPDIDKKIEENIERCLKEEELNSPTIEINFKFTCDYEMIESEMKEFLELFGEISSLNYDMNANSLKINYKYYLSSMYANYYLNHLIYENKRKNKYENYLLLTAKEEESNIDIEDKKSNSGPNEKQSEDIFKFIKFLTENYKSDSKSKLHETPIKSAEIKTINKLFPSSEKKEKEIMDKNKEYQSNEKAVINPEKKINSNNIIDPNNLIFQQNSETPVKKQNALKNYSANNIISNDKPAMNNKKESNISSVPLRPFNSSFKPPFMFMPYAPAKMNMKFQIPIPVLFPVTSPFISNPFYENKRNKNMNKEDKKGQKIISSESKPDENKINSCIIDHGNNNPINSINYKIENDNSQSQNDKNIKEIFDNINNKIANISNNSNDSTNSNEKNNINDNISNDVNVDSSNKSNSDLGSSNKNMSNKSDSTIKTEKVNKSNNATAEELGRIIDIKKLEEANMNKSINSIISNEGKIKSNSSSERNSDFMSSLKGKALSLERLNNYLQENKPVSNFSNPVLSLNPELQSEKDNTTIYYEKEEEREKKTVNEDKDSNSKIESPSNSKKYNSNKESTRNNNPMNNYFNPMYNFFYIPAPVLGETHLNKKNKKMDYPPIPFPYPPMPFQNFYYKNNPINFNKDVIDFNKLTLETKNKVHFMTHSSRNYCYKYVCNYTVQIENDNLFMVTKRIIGKNGCFLKKILQESCIKYGDYSTKIRLRGKGSGYIDKSNSENEEPLMLSVSSLNYPTYYNCCLLLDNLMNKIYDDYYDHLHKILPKELQYSIIKKKLIKNEFVVDRVNSVPFNNCNSNYHDNNNLSKKEDENVKKENKDKETK